MLAMEEDYQVYVRRHVAMRKQISWKKVPAYLIIQMASKNELLKQLYGVSCFMNVRSELLKQ